jgi:hypothetical protein
VYQVRFSGKPVFGIQEIRALGDGFSITFFTPVPDRKAAEDRKQYQVRRYHHVYQGEYHSPPTDEQTLHVESAQVFSDGKTVHLKVREAPLADRIYELRTTLPAQPAVGHYTMNRCPTQE